LLKNHKYRLKISNRLCSSTCSEIYSALKFISQSFPLLAFWVKLQKLAELGGKDTV